MGLPLSLLRNIQSKPGSEAWSDLFEFAWKVCAEPLAVSGAASQVTKRDADIGAMDHFLATAGWDLWQEYEATVPRTADVLADWWEKQEPGRAVLILDALSLREVPWLLQGAKKHGYVVNQARATGAELPPNTTPFANALGFPSRSYLQSNGGASTGYLTGAVTESTGLPWADCASQIKPVKDLLFWHSWLDDRLHKLGEPGHGLAALVPEAAENLGGDAFWALVDRMSTGRKVVVTADHGYAASGQFPDNVDPAQVQYLKERYRSGRAVGVDDLPKSEFGAWVPPIDLRIDTKHGEFAFVSGRRKWKSAGGYPTLTHGGLTLLEVAVPFIELSRQGGA